MKDRIITFVLNELTSLFDHDQLKAVESAMIRALYNVEIVTASTEVSTSCVDNENALKLYTMSLTVEHHSQKTIKQYLYALRNLFDFIHKDFRDITSDDIKYYLAYMESTKKWQSSTTNNTRKYLKSFFTWADENDYISKNPLVKIKPFKVTQAKKCTLDDEEIELMRDSAADPLSLAIVDLLNATGLRVSELCLLNRDDINIVTGKVNVFAPKTQTYRTVFLDAKARKHVNDYYTSRTDADPAAFVTKRGIRIYPQQVEALLRKVSQSAGMTKRVTVHTFRKTLASRLFRRHVDLLTIATILGHATTATTEKYYIKVDCSDIQYQYDLVS